MSSRLIQLSEKAKKKAKRRFIGSIFLLIIAIIIFYRIVSKTHITQLNPKTIEIKSTTHIESNYNLIKSESSNNIGVASTNISDVATQESIIESKAQVVARESGNFSKGNIVANNISPESSTIADSQEQISDNSAHNPPQIKYKFHVVNTVEKKQLSPEDILNGKTKAVTTSKYFLETNLDSNLTDITEFKNSINNKHEVHLITIKNKSVTNYKLRIGPFSSSQEALQAKKDLN